MLVKRKNTIIYAIVCIFLSLNLLFIPNNNIAKAWFDVPNLAVNTPTAIATTIVIPVQGTTAAAGTGDFGANLGNWGTAIADFAKKIGDQILDNIAIIAVAVAKVAAIMLVQTITSAIAGSGSGSGGSGGKAISDWNKYLYTSPQQKAMTQMTAFFNTVSKGRLSSVNYEGVGSNYDAYLVGQAKKSFAGQTFSTNLQEVATEPGQMFASNNVKGLMMYMQCANNVACYTLTSSAQYQIELDKATQIAKNEQNNGFLPVKVNGQITKPASVVSTGLNMVDKLGTDLIMNAAITTKSGLGAALLQIAGGAALNITAKSINYMTSDPAGQAAIRNSNNNLPAFSIGYSSEGGLSLGAGGAKTSTGIGAGAVKTITGAAKSNCRAACVANGGNDTECESEC